MKGIIYGPLVNSAPGAWHPKERKGIGKHLEIGVVKYDNADGSSIVYLLTKEAIEKMRPTAAGKPVVGKSGNFDHVKVVPGKKYDGEVTDSFWDGESGWESINFTIDDPKTAEACEDGFQFSCAYVPTDVDETPGVWHNVPYDAVIKDGEFTHFAIVNSPRYEGATIELFNSKKNGEIVMNKVLKAIMAMVPIKELKEVLNSIEDDKKKEQIEKKNAALAKAKTDFDNAMKNAATDDEKAKAKLDFEKANAEAEKLPLGGGDVVPEPGLPTSQAAPAASETPEQKAAAEKAALEKKNADEAAAKEKAAQEAKDMENAGDTAKADALFEEYVQRYDPHSEGKSEVYQPDRIALWLQGKGLSQADQNFTIGRWRQLLSGENSKEALEKKNRLDKMCSDMWARFTGDMVDDGSAKAVLSNSAGRVRPLAEQPAKVQDAWRAAVSAAEGASEPEKLNSLAKKAKATVELRSTAAAQAKKEAAEKAERVERFNALKKAAEERGGTVGTPFVGFISVQDKENLGRERYGSRA